MQSSVTQVFIPKPDTSPEPVRNKKPCNSAPGQNPNSFRSHLKTAAQVQKKPVGDRSAEIPEDLNGAALMNPVQAQDSARDTLTAPAAALPETLPAQLLAAGDMALEPLSETVAKILDVLPAAQPISEAVAAKPGEQVSASVAPAVSDSAGTAAPLTAASPESASSGTQEEGHHADSEKGKERFNLMYRENRHQVLLKLKIEPHSEDQRSAFDSAPGQARKLMEFENHRLTASQLSEAVKSGEDSADTETEPQADSDLMITVRENPAGTRITARISPTPVAHDLVQVDDLFEQIVERAKLMVKVNGAEMNIDLKPDSLGKLSIKVLFEDGLLTARFVTDNHQVKQMLESNLNTLRHNLENQGIKVDRTEVEVQVGNQTDFGASGSWNREGWSGRDDLKPVPYNLEDEIPPVELETDPVFNRTTGGLYGYQVQGEMNWLI